jgi:hypothetical protein
MVKMIFVCTFINLFDRIDEFIREATKANKSHKLSKKKDENR